MSAELVSALCLVAVLEGLFLLVAPRGWKRAAEQLQAMPDRQLRLVGAIAAAIGVAALWLVRG
ncbi:DUF2065 domain-containing protein [Lysobacter silvisoli]|uniref:DUF2065 family protein n=1 Tax=Lysobacter silvisoli TaxID=2293254 RepID=A0A371K5K8_9GAMM|nr:DUF2065 family protein [Lysobacter silvisoli]RDZ29142.1 DUF2065 family protein [Lysobacter silvisoli]